MAIIKLSRGKAAIVDDIDYTRLMTGPKWCCDSKGYAVRHIRLINGCRSMEKMHRLIIGAIPGQKVDHRDHNTLNNQRYNLRTATVRFNGQNRVRTVGKKTSVYKGVYMNNWGKYRASIRVNGVAIHLGMFTKEETAAHAYDEAARRYFGEFARTNFDIMTIRSVKNEAEQQNS